MKTSESISKIAPALVRAQAAMGVVKKDKTGKIETKSGRNYEYQYADFAAVIEEIRPALRAEGLAMIQWSERRDDGIGVITRLQHDSGEWQEAEVFIPVAFSTAQAVGSALTYGKRYGAQSFMLLPSADDDGKEATAAPPPRPNTATQVAADALATMPDDEQKFLHGQAMIIIETHVRGEDALAYIEGQHFDNEEKLALWSLLPSNVRSAIKKEQAHKIAGEIEESKQMQAKQKQNSNFTAEELGSQP